MSFLDLKLNNINYQLGVLTAQSGKVNVGNTQASSVFYPMFCPTFGSVQPVSINQVGLTYRPNTDTLTSTGLISSSLSSATITTSKITGEQSFSLNAATGMSVGISGTSIGISLTTPNANNFSVGQKVIVQGNANAYFNGVEYTITQINSSYILQTNNPTAIPSLEVGGGGTVSGGIITTRDLTATNLNGKLNVVGQTTSTAGNILYTANTTNTTGNYDLLTDASQHFTFTGGSGAGSNILSIGGATNGSIRVPSTAGSVTANKIASNPSIKLSLDSLETNGTIEIQKSGVKTGEILYANATFPLQIKSTLALSLDAGTGGNLHLSSGGASGGSAINLITAGVARAQVVDGGLSCYNLQNFGNNNLNLTAFWAGGNPAILFNSNSYNNINAQGRYMVVNSAGVQFEDGNSAGPTLLAGVNNVGFYIPSSGYLIPGIRFNTFFGGTFPNVDMVLFPNAGGTVSITSLGTNPVYSNGGRLSNTGPSDRTLKENINPLNPQLENILKLRPVSFNWIDKKWNGDKLYNGFIAQEVQEINDISGLVSTFKDNHDNDKLGFDVIGLIPFIVKAVQEQNELIVNQQKQIDDLKLLVNQLLNK